MYRKHVNYIENWFYRNTRKPLIIRGARQVGKTTTVNLAAKELNIDLITINMEDHHSFTSELSNNNPKTIFELIALSRGKHSLDPEKTLLFFDEAQEHPAIIPFLRYCFEKTPEFRVILTGSLLEFVLNAPNFSFPVGRVEFLFMGPMTFTEYLYGINQTALADNIKGIDFKHPITPAHHQLYLEHLRTYTVVGGMPEAVKVYRDTQSWLEVARVKASILETYRADFGKYYKKTNSAVIQQMFEKIPLSLAQKTIFSKLTEGTRTETSKKAFEALSLALVVSPCYHSSGNGIPLASEQKSNHFKTFFLDVGLSLSALGLNIDSVTFDLNNIAKGAIAEQLIAQHLLDDRELFQKPQLHYWQRQKQGTNAEIDFLSTYQNHIVPIEVKSGAVGSMKSLQVFIKLKQEKPHYAIRFLGNLPEHELITEKETGHHYQLISLPHYMVEYWRKFIDSLPAS